MLLKYTKLLRNNPKKFIKLYQKIGNHEQARLLFNCCSKRLKQIVTKLKQPILTRSFVKQTSYYSILNRLKKIPKVQLAWLAGILDGEGTISINRVRNTYKPYLSVGSTTPIMQETIFKILHLSYVKEKHAHSKLDYHSDYVLWETCSLPEVAAVLEVVGPFIVVKTEQAKLVRSYCLRRIKNNKDREYFMQVFDKVKCLNRRSSETFTRFKIR